MTLRSILIGATVLAVVAIAARRQVRKPAPSEADLHKARVAADRLTLSEIKAGR